MISLKEHFKNRLLNSLLEGVVRRQLPPRGIDDYSQHDFEDPIDPIDPIELSDIEYFSSKRPLEKIDNTVANILDPRGRLMGRDFELLSARREAARNNAFNAMFKQRRFDPRDPERTSATRWAKTSFVRDEESSRPPTEEEKAKKETTRRLLNTVHYFSREHGIQLKPEHIEGIDFSIPNFQAHINTVSSRLGL